MDHNKTSVHHSYQQNCNFFISGLKKASQRSAGQGAAERLSEGARQTSRMVHVEPRGIPSRGVCQVIEGVNKEDLIAAGVSCLIIIIAPYPS